MISEKKGKYPFIVANTDAIRKSRTHWWSILDIEPKADKFFFYSFGVDGLKTLLLKTIEKVIEKVLFKTEQMTRTDNKITLVNIKFKGELHCNYIFLHFAIIGLEWYSITLFTRINIFFLPKLTFQHHLHKIYIYGLLFANMNLF